MQRGSLKPKFCLKQNAKTSDNAVAYRRSLTHYFVQISRFLSVLYLSDNLFYRIGLIKNYNCDKGKDKLGEHISSVIADRVDIDVVPGLGHPDIEEDAS